jgi:hypothetical protein
MENKTGADEKDTRQRPDETTAKANGKASRHRRGDKAKQHQRAAKKDDVPSEKYLTALLKDALEKFPAEGPPAHDSENIEHQDTNAGPPRAGEHFDGISCPSFKMRLVRWKTET